MVAARLLGAIGENRCGSLSNEGLESLRVVLNSGELLSPFVCLSTKHWLMLRNVLTYSTNSARLTAQDDQLL